MVTFDKEKLGKVLDSLKELPRIREVTALAKRLQKEKEKLEPEPVTIPTISAEQKRIVANQKRSRFMKGVWDYAKLIFDNYPQLREQFGIKDLVSQYFARRRGQDVSINDVFWQNPSPSASLRP